MPNKKIDSFQFCIFVVFTFTISEFVIKLLTVF